MPSASTIPAESPSISGPPRLDQRARGAIRGTGPEPSRGMKSDRGGLLRCRRNTARGAVLRALAFVALGALGARPTPSGVSRAGATGLVSREHHAARLISGAA
jgi:hypothetical protein